MKRMAATFVLVALSMSAVGLAACGKKDDSGGADSAAPPPPPPPPATAAPTSTSDVATYPNMIPQGGTVKLLVPFVVHQAASNDSPVLSHLGVGQFINLKASYSNWMLVEWPSGVGQLSPGWIELKDVNDSRVQTHQPDAGVVDAGHPVIDAGRPKIIIPTANIPTPKPKVGH